MLWLICIIAILDIVFDLVANGELKDFFVTLVIIGLIVIVVIFIAAAIPQSYKTPEQNNKQSAKTKRSNYAEGAERERALMTRSLRYNILQRDNFRCQICGRTQNDGVKLHVDHIIPVSKGGKTVPNNLRTLCEDCNRGKAAKYNPNGLN